MRLSITNAVLDVLRKRFENMMLNEGAFPDVNFGKGNGFKSYNMIEYSTTWATFAKVVDELIKVSFDPKLGVYTRKRSSVFLKNLETLVGTVTEMDVINSRERFKTWVD